MDIKMELSPQVESYRQFREHLKNQIQDKLKAILTNLSEQEKISFNPNVSVEIDEVTFSEADEERAALIREKTLEEPLSIWVNPGNGQFQMNLGLLPRLTERGSFIHNGAEYCTVLQLRRSSGIFLSRNSTAKGYRDVMDFRPEKGIHLSFKRSFNENLNKFGPVEVVFPSGKKIALSTFVKFLDIPTRQSDNFHVNRKLSERSLNKIISLFGIGQQSEENNIELIRGEIKNRFFSSLLGRHGRLQLNRRIKLIDTSYSEISLNITPMDIANLLQIFEMFNRHEIEEDDPWDLANRKVKLIGDFLTDAVESWARWINKRIEKKTDASDEIINQEGFIDMLKQANSGLSGRTIFTQQIRKGIFDLPLTQRISKEQNNYLEAAGLTRRIKFISGDYRRQPREFHWSHYGRLCPLDTPQSDDVGTMLSLALNARVNEAGVIESQCYQVLHNESRTEISETAEFLPPWEETTSDFWVAFPDQREALLRGERVYAHKGKERYELVDANDVGYIHADEAGMYSLVANFVPYRKHNDSLRGVMACSMLRQALPIKNGNSPRVGTGFEARLPKELPFSYGEIVDGSLAFGKELLVAYLPWQGWNFEDAIVVSESAANTLTSIHDSVVFVQLRRSIEEHKRTLAKAVENAEIKQDFLNDLGVIKDRFVSHDDLLVIEKGLKNKPRIHKVPEGKQGTVYAVDVIDGEDSKGGASLRITLRQERRAQVGDKLANRHGHKGVISRIFPDHEMPYFVMDENNNSDNQCPCGETRPHQHLQILINPLSVISRMNLGQLYETIDARSENLKDHPQRIPCFDPSNEDIKQRKLDSDILVGEQYFMKLDHNAEDKWHARSREPQSYNSFVDQPLKGRRLQGGQRVGEMEVWALMAHNASAITQEMLTLKSDNPRERSLLFQSLLGSTSITPTPQLPEALRTFAACCYGLGLKFTLTNHDGHSIEILTQAQDSENVRAIQLGLLNQTEFMENLSQGEITTPVIKSRDGDSKYEVEGLESEQIFGPEKNFSCACGKYLWGGVTDEGKKRPKPKRRPKECESCGTPLLPSHSRRHRMGHIKLEKRVPNPYIFLSNSFTKWPYINFRSLLMDEPRFNFIPPYEHERDPADRIGEGWDWVYEFCVLALKYSESFRHAFEKKLHATFAGSAALDNTALMQDEEYSEIVALLKESIGDEDNTIEVEDYVDQVIDEYGPDLKGLKAVGLFMAEVLQEGEICGIDFAIDILRSDKRFETLCLDVLPVLPPKLRQRFFIGHKKGQGKKYKAHDLNVLYKKVLQRNEDLGAALVNLDKEIPGSRSEYKKCRTALQLAVSQLLCNQLLPPRKRERDWETPGYPVRHSISSYLEDKDGLLLGHLLGKRVDYSGRAVIVPDPTLPVDTCRIPTKLAIKLYRPQLIAELRKSGVNGDPDDLINQAVQGGENALEQVKRCLVDLISIDQTVLAANDINTLLDQAKHGDVGAKEKVEKQLKSGITASLSSSKNLPMVLLNRQPTLHRLGMMGFKVELGDDSVIAISPLVTAGFNADFDGDQMAIYLPISHDAQLEASQMVPSNHLWHPANGRYALSMAQDLALGGYLAGQGNKRKLVEYFEKSFNDADLLHRIEDFKIGAFDKSTQAGISFSIDDLKQLAKQYFDSEDRNQNVGVIEAERIIEQLISTAPDEDIFKKILISGARGDWQKMNYLAGRSQERVNSNLTLGLNVGEELKAAVSGRRNLVDTKLGTAEGGALTKKYVSAAHHLWITEEDCGTEQGLPVSNVEYVWTDTGIRENKIRGDAAPLLFRRLYGRVLAEDFGSYRKGICLDRQKALEIADILAKSDQEEKVIVRSASTCKVHHGVCRTCYGLPWTRGTKVDRWSESDLVAKGERVGIIAAQAIGEPGTQMALRKKHVVGEDDAPGIDAVNDFVNKVSKTLIQDYAQQQGIAEGLVILRDTMDQLYRDNNTHLAPVHFEVVFAGRLRNESGWLANAADNATTNIHSVIVKAAIENAVDNLQGLKECSVIGAELPEV